MNKMDELLELYNSDKNIKSYVDRYSKQNEVDVKTALTHLIVLEYIKYENERSLT